MDSSKSIDMTEVKNKFNWKAYVALARPDHWVKHVFMIPGMVFAYILTGQVAPGFPYLLAIGLSSACFAASANYVINEWLDAEFDKHHPIKKNRPSVTSNLSGTLVWIEYAVLFISSLILGSYVGPLFLTGIGALLFQGIIYNIEPIRTKDKFIVDVVSESINNPIRLILGWGIVNQGALAPSSLFVAYWFGGAFLMASKRLAEFRHLTGQGHSESLKLYRKSFQVYTEKSLLLSSFLYAILSVFFISAFLIRYRVEYLLLFPILATLYTYYLALTLKDSSAAQTPEKLHKDKGLLSIVAMLAGVFVMASFFDIPVLEKLMSFNVIEFDFLKVNR